MWMNCPALACAAISGAERMRRTSSCASGSQLSTRAVVSCMSVPPHWMALPTAARLLARSSFMRSASSRAAASKAMLSRFFHAQRIDREALTIAPLPFASKQPAMSVPFAP